MIDQADGRRKVLKSYKLSEKMERSQLMRVLRHSLKLRHANITPIEEWFLDYSDDVKAVIVSPFCEKGTLRHYLHLFNTREVS